MSRDELSGAIELYPVAIIEDRYSGTYSGGKWFAVSCWDNADRREAIERASGGDAMCAEFWENPPPWVGVGDTPDAALAALDAKMGVA